MANHASILTMSARDIPEISPLPEGSYLATISGTPKVGNFGQKQTPGVEFSFRLNQALEDVDPEQLASAGGLGELPLTYTFWDTPKAGGMLKAFLVNVLKQDDAKTPMEMFAELPGTQCIVKITHRYKNNDKTTRPYPQITAFAPVG